MAETDSHGHSEGDKKARLQAENEEFHQEEKAKKQEELHQQLLSPKGSHTENKELSESRIHQQPGVREKRPAFTYKTGAVYEGEWMDGVRDGHGVQNWPDGAKYQGGRAIVLVSCLGKGAEWKNNKANGHGTFYHADGDVYEGYEFHLDLFSFEIS